MIVARENDEILVRFTAGDKASKIQSILDYLRYEELTSKSNVSEKHLDGLLKSAKKNRLENFKKETGIDG